MKHIKRNSLIIFVTTIFVLVFALKDDFSAILTTFQKMDYRFILLALFVYVLYLFLKAYANYIFIADKEKVSLKESFIHNVITQFFNGITPFSTGGQPMEVYMLKEHHIRTTKATNIIMQNFIVYQLALVLFGIFAVSYNGFTQILQNNGLLKNLIVLGFLINTLVAVFLFFVAISQKFTNFVMHLIVNLGTKLHFIKDKDKMIKKWEERLVDFHQYTKELKTKKKLFILGILLNLLSLACFYSIPLFLTYSLHDYTSLNLIATLVASAYVLIIGSFVPIPGATGGIEYGFIQMFGNFLPANELSAIMIIWRFITYYLGMIVGGILFNIHQGGKK